MAASGIDDGRSAAGQDAALVDALEACDRYLEDHERASELLKQGFLKLARARRRLPDHALGELSFRESFEALVVVSVPSDGEGAWQLERPGTAEPAKVPEASASLTLRKKTAQSSVSSERDTKETGMQPSSDAILWFSSLPPNDLRQAQKLFAGGLRALVDAAADAQKVRSAANR